MVVGAVPLVIEDRPGVDEDHRWQARLKGRSCGGYLTGTGPTARAAVEELAAQYERELENVRAAAERLPIERAPRRRSRP